MDIVADGCEPSQPLPLGKDATGQVGMRRVGRLICVVIRGSSLRHPGFIRAPDTGEIHS